MNSDNILAPRNLKKRESKSRSMKNLSSYFFEEENYKKPIKDNFSDISRNISTNFCYSGEVIFLCLKKNILIICIYFE
jgi:hypothetical protein